MAEQKQTTVLVLTFKTAREDKNIQLTISKPALDLEKDALSASMDAIIATGAFEKQKLVPNGKKSAAYKTTVTDELTLN